MLGVAAQVIQKLAGHSSRSVTERYAHLSPAHAGVAIHALDGRAVNNTLTDPSSGAT